MNSELTTGEVDVIVKALDLLATRESINNDMESMEAVHDLTDKIITEFASGTVVKIVEA